MKRNLFKDNKIFYLLSNRWTDGSHYKLPRYFAKEFGVLSGNEIISTDIDLGICQGDAQTLYLEFLKRGIPYLLVENDVHSFRFGLNEKSYAHDKQIIENASAIIFTSEGYVEYFKEIKKKYGWYLPEYIVVHNKPMRQDTKFIPRVKTEGLNLVLDGGLTMWDRNNDFYHYKAYHLIFNAFIKAGWKVHLYPTKLINERRIRDYISIGCIIHEWVKGDKIYQEMSQYTAGLQAFNSVDTPESAINFAHKCRPNKLYDYLAAGIPTIGYNGGDGMEVYRDKWGIVIDDLNPETLKAIPERLEKIKITKKMKNDNVLEKEKGKFENIIKIALKEAKNKDRKRYYVTDNPFKINDATIYPKKIKVFNKGVITIYRGGYLFLPNKTSEELTVNIRTYKEIKSHVSLRIEQIG
jgi:hypothetical protein